MKKFIALAVALLLAASLWRLSGSIAIDAMGIATGVVFGVLAGLPMALIILAGRRKTRYP